jgi:hypothetical protein|tara:strand:+ start:3405 stop:3656 length:252 start_codon:yes stop_codon:yes gene_type:complete
MYKEYYKDDETVMQIVRLGRDLITKCEENGIFFENTEEDYVKWNAAVTAGNKLTTYGTPWGLKSTEQLLPLERKVILEYLDSK